MLVCLHAEISCVEEFLSTLDREEQVMTNGFFADLPPITEQKTRLLDRMAELDQQRGATQVALGFEPGRAGADAAAAAGGASTRQAWANLLLLARNARTNNLRNGSMVYTHLDFTQRTLHVLQAGTQLFYGPDGARKTAAGAGTRLALG